MSFYSKARKPQFEAKIIPAGDYECRVVSALEKANDDGQVYIEFQFKVREDVDQPCKGSIIKKRFKPDADGNYKVNKIDEYAFACGVEELAKRTGLTPKAVHMRIFRTRERLRAYLSERGYEV